MAVSWAWWSSKRSSFSVWQETLFICLSFSEAGHNGPLMLINRLLIRARPQERHKATLIYKVTNTKKTHKQKTHHTTNIQNLKYAFIVCDYASILSLNLLTITIWRIVCVYAICLPKACHWPTVCAHIHIIIYTTIAPLSAISLWT